MANNEKLTLYAIRDALDGTWYKNSYTWTASIQDAKIFTKIGQARSRHTWLLNAAAGRSPDAKPPVLVEIQVASYRDIDETERVAKVQRARRERLARKEVAAKRRELESAERALQEARHRVEKAAAGVASVETIPPSSWPFFVAWAKEAELEVKMLGNPAVHRRWWAEVRRPFQVTDPDLDAPDGATIFLPERGGRFERRGGFWCPIG